MGCVCGVASAWRLAGAGRRLRRCRKWRSTHKVPVRVARCLFHRDAPATVGSGWISSIDPALTARLVFPRLPLPFGRPHSQMRGNNKCGLVVWVPTHEEMASAASMGVGGSGFEMTTPRRLTLPRGRAMGGGYIEAPLLGL